MSTISLFFIKSASEGSVAIITQDGKELERIDLSDVKSSYSLVIDSPNGGYNLVLVEKDNISVIEASCTDKVCVHQGKISSSLRPIVCLPNKMMIIIEGPKDDDGIDSVTG